MPNSSRFAVRGNLTFGVMGGKSGNIAARNGKVGGKNGKVLRDCGLVHVAMLAVAAA